MIDLCEAFKSHEDEFLKAEGDMPKDLEAFIYLQTLVPSDEDIIVSAEHDKIWLSTDMEMLAKVATDEDILYLVRRGVMYDGDGLTMFV